jgi:hypothetical protein
MSTDQLELLVATSLHENDSQTVDVAGGRAVLRERIEQDQRAGRRRTFIGIAAAVLAVVVTMSLLLTGALRDEQAVPVHPAPPKVALSPSGLPVGLLSGTYEQDGLAGAFLLLVRADGSGQLSSGAGHWRPSPGRGSGAFDVAIRQGGPGRVSLVYDNPVSDREVVTMNFVVRARSVTIVSLGTPGNGLLTKASASAITGTTLDVLPAPPSGLCCAS